MKISKKKFERMLNELLSDAYSFDDAMEAFEYITNKNRVQHCTMKHLRKCYHERKLGSLLRKYDSIAFEVAYCEENKY